MHVFIIPRREGTVSFIIDDKKLKHKIVRKKYPFIRIGEKMQKL